MTTVEVDDDWGQRIGILQYGICYFSYEADSGRWIYEGWLTHVNRARGKITSTYYHEKPRTTPDPSMVFSEPLQATALRNEINQHLRDSHAGLIAEVRVFPS